MRLRSTASTLGTRRLSIAGAPSGSASFPPQTHYFGQDCTSLMMGSMVLSGSAVSAAVMEAV